MLELCGLTKKFGDKVAVDGLNLTIERGEFFSLLGPNAAGKTTTVKMIVGLLQPSAGAVRIEGHDVHSEPLKAKSSVGYVPDDPFLYDKLTVSETLDFVASVYGGGRERSREKVLSLFNLSGVRNLLSEQLSHGFKQRLVFAMAMIHEPRLMIVDEPLVGLDPRSARKVKDALKERARSGGAVFMCTHTLSVAEELADRIGILSRGRLIALGTLHELQKKCGGAGGLEEIFLHITEKHCNFEAGR